MAGMRVSTETTTTLFRYVNIVKVDACSKFYEVDV